MKEVNVTDELDDASSILAEVVVAWLVFKSSHDLDSKEFKCCERTEALFNALTVMEKWLYREDGKNGNRKIRSMGNH